MMSAPSLSLICCVLYDAPVDNNVVTKRTPTTTATATPEAADLKTLLEMSFLTSVARRILSSLAELNYSPPRMVSYGSSLLATRAG